tara:strand:+ start:408 stop:938 length:531 start_codon:yes stop_codon:yes gene_type:complete
MWSRSLNREQKEIVVKELGQIFSESGVVLVAHYSGLTVSDMSQLRIQMRNSGSGVKVAKNRLSKIALDGKLNAGLTDFLKGQTVLLFSEDPLAAVKVAVKFSEVNEKLSILGGSMGEEILNLEGIKNLSKMPSREELIGTIAGCIGAPASELAQYIVSPGNCIAGIVSTIEEKKAA